MIKWRGVNDRTTSAIHRKAQKEITKEAGNAEVKGSVRSQDVVTQVQRAGPPSKNGRLLLSSMWEKTIKGKGAGNSSRGSPRQRSEA